MESLFVMDPLHRIHVAGDSTYAVMREHSRRGYAVWWCTPDGLYVRDGVAHARAQRVEVRDDAPWFHPVETTEGDLGRFDVVWMRKDPPYDMAYMLGAFILDMTPARTLVVNEPRGLRVFNEKLWAMQFARFQPPTLLSSDLERLRRFVEAQPGKAVLKPWDGNGGRGVLVTQAGDRNLQSMLELLTREGTTPIIAQGYIEGVERGDKRILLFDGEPVGALLRIPVAKDHRANMHVGARVEACELDEADRRICDALGPELKRHGMIFVGIDVIAGVLTEINVTSPTGIREIDRLTGACLESDLVDIVQRRLEAHRARLA